MPKPMRLEDDVELPSGRSVRVTRKWRPHRPWHVVGSGVDARVCRAHANSALPSVEFYQEPDTGDDLILEEADAKAVVVMLNWRYC